MRPYSYFEIVKWTSYFSSLFLDNDKMNFSTYIYSHICIYFFIYLKKKIIAVQYFARHQHQDGRPVTVAATIATCHNWFVYLWNNP